MVHMVHMVHMVRALSCGTSAVGSKATQWCTPGGIPRTAGMAMLSLGLDEFRRFAVMAGISDAG